ncbi:MAG TPA: sigma-54 dependent transcriptional regulator [Candidatus Hydrogenedentes bacterium]|nr:sigma-54 dependent transcriptional regulator [Candidatus Hydrogenedentota bacterium]HOV73369.1 sigma-54 dependent transcriptional regulator [Candidatus Hydrogenedentota bacterium]
MQEIEKRTAARTIRGSVAVIDDDDAARMSIGQMLKLRRYEVALFASAEAALASPRLMDMDCIVTDIKMPGMDGEAFLAETLRQGYTCPVIMITGHGDVSMAVRCLKSGAYDFIEKPFEDDVLLAGVARAVERRTLRRESEELRRRLAMLSPEEDGRFGMVGRSRAMRDLYAQIEAVARVDAPVLIFGETGAGKELVARAIHQQSARSDKPFVPVNAGGLPETMLESELFGHVRGAFTGADADRDGKLITAAGGSLLLDEIESISERAQVQLLRVIEDGLVQPLGRDLPRKADVRLIAASKADLAEQVRLGRMREDFYHRIAVLTISVPSLRERTEDIPLLTALFLKQASMRYGMEIPQIPEDTLKEMLHHPWPGNVRELRNVVERMMITARDGVCGAFEPDDSLSGARLLSLPATPGRLRDEMEHTERTVIEAALRDNRGEINATCRVLGISRRALYERMKKYELYKETYR